MSTDRDATQLERLAFFSDAVFAIAITLLVIEVRVPDLHAATHAATDGELQHALLALIPKYIGFLVSFIVIGRFWLGHHRMFGMLRRADNKLIAANLMLLFGIAFMPFPTAVFSEYAGLRTAALLYTGWLVVLGLFNWRLIGIGVGEKSGLLAEDFDPAARRLLLTGRWQPIAIGLSAMAATLVHPTLPLLVLVLGIPLANLIVRLATRREPKPDVTD